MHAHRHTAPSHGFSLVELSIVLVILGLLVGGILSGKSLIRASELRTVYTQAHGFATAASAFRDKYFYIPGDMPNATQFWGSAGGTGSDAVCFNTASTTAATCNGNGNGVYNDLFGTTYESYRAWQQMANAGLIQGSYSGTLGGAHNASNSPVGKLKSSFWGIYSGKAAQGGTAMIFGTPGTHYDVEYNNYLSLGGTGGVGVTVLSPEETWNIDAKIDDGKPGAGKMVVFGNRFLDSCTTSNSSTAYTADYLLTQTSVGCGPIFRQAF